MRKLQSVRGGLTLMELVVVLTVLAALAAIVIPMFPNMLRRAHKATDATQSSEIAKLVQLHQAAFLSYPDGFDLLTDGTAFPAYVPSDGGATFGGYVTAGTLTADELAALRRVGITTVHKLAPDTTPVGFHPTMSPYTGNFAASLVDLTGAAGATTNFAILASNAVIDAKNPAFLQTIRNTDPTARFVVFGVGPRCAMVGTTIQDAPTSVPQNKSFTPETLYSRVGVIFMVSGVEVTRTERARFIGSVALEDDELETTEKDIVGYYGVLKTGN